VEFEINLTRMDHSSLAQCCLKSSMIGSTGHPVRILKSSSMLTSASR